MDAKECQTLIDSIKFVLNLDFDIFTLLDQHQHLLCEEDEESADLASKAKKAKGEESKDIKDPKQKMKKEMLGMLKKYGVKCDDPLQVEKFTINLGSIMSHLTDVICSETKGGYM